MTNFNIILLKYYNESGAAATQAVLIIRLENAAGKRRA